MIQTSKAINDVAPFVHKNFKGQYRTRYRNEKLLNFLVNPDHSLKADDYEILKDDTSTVTVVRNLIEAHPIVVKRYNKKNAWHALRCTVRRSRAENCWMQAIVLENLNIAIAPPVAIIQEYLGAGLKSRSWYLSEFVDGPSCLDYLLTVDSESERKSLMEQIVDTLQILWNNCITHGDLKGTNILIAQNQTVILDLDAMKQHGNEPAARRRIRKDVERFLRNWKCHHPTLYELARKKIGDAGFLEL